MNFVFGTSTYTKLTANISDISLAALINAAPYDIFQMKAKEIEEHYIWYTYQTILLKK